MGSVNKVILIGNLGKDAEVRVTPGGQSVASFSIATTENWTSKEGERKEQTEWHRIVLWGKAADSLQPYLVKGKQIYLEGRLQTRQWEKEGQKHYTTEVKADKIVLLGSARGGGDRQADRGGDAAGYQDPMQQAAPVTDDDIPSRFPSDRAILETDHVVRFGGRHFEHIRLFDRGHAMDCGRRHVHRITGPHLGGHELPVHFALEQDLPGPDEDRLVLLVVVLQAERVALVDVDSCRRSDGARPQSITHG
jgi:single-strand DNA-binding protein